MESDYFSSVTEFDKFAALKLYLFGSLTPPEDYCDRIRVFPPGQDTGAEAVVNMTSYMTDAKDSMAGNDAFVLDGDASFSEGEIRQSVVSGSLLVEFNANADSAAEMSILLQGRTTLLVARDFAL